MEWSNESPKTEGSYWFYGEWLGAMGCHFTGDYVPEPRLFLVQIHKASNGMMASTDGYFVPLKPFNVNVSREGYDGKWAVAILPELPS